MVKVVDLDYNGAGRLRIDLEGHPTDVIEHARKLATIVLGSSPWRITSIEGNIPTQAYYDSEMKFKIIAEVKE